MIDRADDRLCAKRRLRDDGHVWDGYRQPGQVVFRDPRSRRSSLGLSRCSSALLRSTFKVSGARSYRNNPIARRDVPDPELSLTTALPCSLVVVVGVFVVVFDGAFALLGPLRRRLDRDASKPTVTCPGLTRAPRKGADPASAVFRRAGSVPEMQEHLSAEYLVTRDRGVALTHVAREILHVRVLGQVILIRLA